MQSLDDFVVDNYPDHSSPNPSEMPEQGDVDKAMDYLLSHASEQEQENIRSMAPAEKRMLAETAYQDKDKAEQIMRHRQSSQKRQRTTHSRSFAAAHSRIFANESVLWEQKFQKGQTQ